MSKFKVAGVQMDIELGNRQSNLDKMQSQLEQTTANGAQLTVFPECTTTGYCFESAEEAKEVSERFDGPAVTRVHQWCREKNTMVVFGFLELDGERIFNALAMVGPDGLLGRYRKIHIPRLGVDRFVTPGDRPFEVIETPYVKIGMNICYDCAFPESARVLAIKGAELIVLPTNWPPTSTVTADVIPAARALENHVYLMAVDRVGRERGYDFIGKSKICDPRGMALASEDHANEAILYAEIDPEFARNKHRVTVPGKHEVHRMNDRRPDVYGPISEPH
jgi:predicted amidohydrolase